MFDRLRQSLADALSGRAAPADRRALLGEMRDTLVQARLGLEEMRDHLARTRSQLVGTQQELETVRRRKQLAAAISDRETVVVAERYEARHAERVAVLERKLSAQEAELAAAERDVDGMSAELRAAMAGVGLATPVAGTPDPLADDLRAELDNLVRARRRDARDAAAEERLAELKRKMGK